MPLNVEQLDPLRVVKEHDINKKFIEVALPGLPWECSSTVRKLVKKVGEWVSGPEHAEELFKLKSPTSKIKRNRWRRCWKTSRYIVVPPWSCLFWGLRQVGPRPRVADTSNLKATPKAASCAESLTVCL